MKSLVDSPSELRPETPWEQTVWAWTSEESLVDHENVSRLCGAALLPFRNGAPDWEGFEASIRWMYAAAEAFGVEFVPVLNADTGYIFNLSEHLYAEVLRRFRGAFPGRRFIAGVTARGAEQDEGFKVNRYLPLMDLVQTHDHCEVMDQIAEHLTRPALVHALEPAFVPWATPFDPWLLWQLALHPKYVGGKISTLDRPHFLYWAAMCRSLKLDFVPHSGDDFGIATAIKLGLPLLIGAAVTGAPMICAAKDMWLSDSVATKRRKTGTGGFDTQVYKLFEAMQSLEDQVFRLDAKGSAGAYKHSTAHFLHRLGILASPEVHPACGDVREGDESARMEEALIRVRRIAGWLEIVGYGTDRPR
jgi:hypothetical protein